MPPISQEIAAGSFIYRASWVLGTENTAISGCCLPALAVILGWLFLFPEHFRELGTTVATQPSLGTNVVFWRTAVRGFFGGLPEIRPTLHTWSVVVLFALPSAVDLPRSTAKSPRWRLSCGDSAVHLPKEHRFIDMG